MFSGSEDGVFHNADDEAEEIFLNLTPMIDVLTTLLFFLLFSFGVVIIALINASVPTLSESPADPETSQDKITMALTITDKALTLNANHDSMTEKELDKLKRTIPKNKSGEYDFPALHEALYQIKQRFPRSSTIIITPASGVTYETLVQAMDASRDRPMQKGTWNYRLPLFPEVVVSTLVE